MDLLDRGVDLLDYYRGRVSTRRMALLVVHDISRMPRTRAAVAGLDPGRPWGETNGQLALLDTRIQAVHGLLWVGLRLKGKPPKINPYPVPEAKKPEPEKQKPKVDPRHRAYLDRFSPGKAPPAPPPKRKPKDRPPGKPGMSERHRAYLDRFAPPKH